MKKYCLYVLLAFFMASYGECGDMQAIKERNKMIVGLIKTDDPPLFMVNEKNELIGEEIELAKLIASDLGVEVEFKRDYESYDAVIEGVANNEVDLGISYLTITLQRAQKVNFSTPYINLHQGIAVNRKQYAILKEPNNLLEVIKEKKLKIGALQGSAYMHFVYDYFGKESLIEFPTYYSMYNAVKNGDIFATLTDEIFLDRYIISYPDAAIYVKTIIISDLKDQIAIALPPESIHFLIWINTFLKTYSYEVHLGTLFSTYSQYIHLQGKE